MTLPGCRGEGEVAVSMCGAAAGTAVEECCAYTWLALIVPFRQEAAYMQELYTD